MRLSRSYVVYLLNRYTALKQCSDAVTRHESNLSISFAFPSTCLSILTNDQDYEGIPAILKAYNGHAMGDSKSREYHFRVVLQSGSLLHCPMKGRK